MLAPGRRHDPAEQTSFADGRVVELSSGRALVREVDHVVYLAISLRNVSTGAAQLLDYHLESQSLGDVRRDPLGPARHRRGDTTPDTSRFLPQQRDLYVPPGDPGF